jgi:hypothetical protein
LRGSNVDLVIGVLAVSVGDAVRWIAERFTVPSIKPGRPVGRRSGDSVLPYRVGVSGLEFEVLIRSGMFGQLSAGARSILITLALFRDPDTTLTRMSYAAISRYAGVKSRASVSKSLKQLARLHAIEVHPGTRIGITRECSSYRVTLDDPKFLDACNESSRKAQAEISLERQYRAELREVRQRLNPRQASTRTEAGHLTVSRPSLSEKEKPSTCEGQDLSSSVELTSNKPVHAVNREISVLPRSIEEQKRILRERGLL